MKDYCNPLLLLIIVVLLACRVSGVGAADSLDMWVLVSCTTAFVVNAALSVARSVTQRKSVMNVVWSVVYLMVGSCGWVMSGQQSEADEAEYASLRQWEEVYRNGGNPFAADENGDCLLTVAASLGKAPLVKELLATGKAPTEGLGEAARRAAENGRCAVLEVMLPTGPDVNRPVGSTTLLCAAAQNGRKEACELLLRHGADVNMTDEDGTTPLIHAVIADAASVVALLVRSGADVARTDADGRSAASYSRSAKVDAALIPPAP